MHDQQTGNRTDRAEQKTSTADPATPGKAPLIVQRAAGSAAPSDPSVVQPIAEQGVSSGGGEIPYRSQMESGFGTSFADVSFHNGSAASAASSAIGADAYTMGNSIAMASSPTPHLVAHELAHVVQQQAGVGPSSGVGTAGDSFEQEADHAAATVAGGGQSDLGAKYGAVTAGMGGAIQRKAVQRYESGEHALLGAGPNYPVGNGNLPLPNGAVVFSGELVAFGDFYSDMVQLNEAPRQEVEALAGICRLEAVWYQARRLAAQGHGTAQDGAASLIANQAAPGSGGNTGGAPPAVAHAETHSPAGPSAAHLTTLPRIEGGNPVWADPTALIGTTGMTVAQCRAQIFNQFSAVWAAFNISFDINTLPETGVGILRATIGRRRFRGTNDSLTRNDDPHAPHPNEHEGPGRDPGNLGGDYLDLATNNLSHFSPDNFAHWRDQHERACRSHATAHDEPTRAMALASDNFGSHFLTDRFSTGHFVDKAELMTYASSMMVDTAREPGRIAGSAGMSDNAVLQAELSNAVNACFADPNVMHQWEAGVNEAIANHTVTSAEGLIMRNLPHGQVAGMITGVLMESPWRSYDQGGGPVDPENAGGGSGPGGQRDAFDRSRGQGPRSQDPATAQANGGAYQLGVGNLAALQVHDALNAIGFTVENGMGRRWRCQGDDHLQQQTMDIANACVVASQGQVTAGQSNPDAIKAYLPQKAWMDPAWIADYFQGQWANAELDNSRIASLQTMVRGQEINLNVDGGHRTAGSDMMTRICHDIMRILFMPRPTGPASHEGDHGTGLNISMLKAFLIRRLGDMVSMAYAAASAADIPQGALELYAPRDGDGHTLPRAANNFTWPSRDQIGFDLNVTGCAPGSYQMTMKCYNRDNGYDLESSGMPGYGLVDSQTRAHGADDTDVMYRSVPIQVTVPPSAHPNDPAAPQIVHVISPVPQHGDSAAARFYHDQDDRYVVVTGDPAGACNIGRSNVRLESMVPANPPPVGNMPKATGPDATSSPTRDPNARPQIQDDRAEWTPPIHVHNDQFTWHDGVVSFRLEAATPAPSDRMLAMNIEVMEHNWVTPDQMLYLEGSQAHFGANQTLSDVVTFYPRGETPYIKIYQNAQMIGESRRTGHDSGHADAPAHGPTSGAHAVSNFVWNGQVLRFQVEPEDVREVYVKFQNSFQASDLAASLVGVPAGAGGYGVMRIPISNGWGAADSSQIPHNVSAHVYRDEACTNEIGESSSRR